MMKVKKERLVLQPNISGIKLEICSTVLGYSIYSVYLDFLDEKNWNKTLTSLSI